MVPSPAGPTSELLVGPWRGSLEPSTLFPFPLTSGFQSCPPPLRCPREKQLAQLFFLPISLLLDWPPATQACPAPSALPLLLGQAALQGWKLKKEGTSQGSEGGGRGAVGVSAHPAGEEPSSKRRGREAGAWHVSGWGEEGTIQGRPEHASHPAVHISPRQCCRRSGNP